MILNCKVKNYLLWSCFIIRVHCNCYSDFAFLTIDFLVLLFRFCFSNHWFCGNKITVHAKRKFGFFSTCMLFDLRSNLYCFVTLPENDRLPNKNPWNDSLSTSLSSIFSKVCWIFEIIKKQCLVNCKTFNHL